MSFWRDEVIEPKLANDVERAIAEQQAILARDARNAGAHYALGTLLNFCGDKQGAVDHFRQSVALDPNYAAAYASLGRLYAVEGDYQSAWEYACEADRLGDGSLLEQLARYLPRPPSAAEE